MLATWTLLVAAAAFWDGLCTHSTYDLRGSTDDCVRWTSLDLSECAAAGEGCASPSTLKQASPRWLGSLAGMGGPLMTWLPLLLGAREPAHVRPVLLAALPWYLALIGPVRHTHRLLDSRWDPSGHVFVYGAQLVPLACIRLGLLHPATQAWLALWVSDYLSRIPARCRVAHLLAPLFTGHDPDLPLDHHRLFLPHAERDRSGLLSRRGALGLVRPRHAGPRRGLGARAQAAHAHGGRRRFVLAPLDGGWRGPLAAPSRGGAGCVGELDRRLLAHLRRFRGWDARRLPRLRRPALAAARPVIRRGSRRAKRTAAGRRPGAGWRRFL